MRDVQNEALGSLLQWRFVSGYQSSRADAGSCPLPLLFIVLPILFDEDSALVVRSTLRQSGLRAFAAKFVDGPKAHADNLLVFHERALALRLLSLSSLWVAVDAKLLSIDVSSAGLVALSKTMPRAGIPSSIQALARDASKLGSWCAALTPHETAVVLKVRF